MSNRESQIQSERDTHPLADRLEYHQETDDLCPKCGSRLLADDIGGFYLKCSKCSWKGDITLLGFLGRLPILKRLLLDEEYRQHLDQAKTWPEIDSVLMEFKEVHGEKAVEREHGKERRKRRE